MTRRAKLMHWAALVRSAERQLGLYHALEYMTPWQRRETMIGRDNCTALGLAASDPAFQAQGLNERSSIEDGLRFFDLTLTQTHAFSCDCGGAISNAEQATRIERLV